MLLNDDKASWDGDLSHVNIHCYSFATPACATADLCDRRCVELCMRPYDSVPVAAPPVLPRPLLQFVTKTMTHIILMPITFTCIGLQLPLRHARHGCVVSSVVCVHCSQAAGNIHTVISEFDCVPRLSTASTKVMTGVLCDEPQRSVGVSTE